MVNYCSCGCGKEIKAGNKFFHGHNRHGLASFTKEGRWSRNFDSCVGCGTTERPHRRDGYCVPCAKKLLRSGTLKRKRICCDGWSRKYESCINCSTTEVPHKALGMCEKCYVVYFERKSGVRERFEWAVGFEKCIGCGTTSVAHTARGLCTNCFESEKRRKAGLSEIPCPVCGVSVNRLAQHASMLARNCPEHLKFLRGQENKAVEMFNSGKTSRQVSEEVYLWKRHVLSLWHSVYGDEAVVLRGEQIRKGKISGKNHYLFGKPIDEIRSNHPRYEYKGIQFRSTWERNLATYLDGIGVEWEYEKYKFLYTDTEGNYHYYWPDFFLPTKNVFIEVKGYYADKDRYKINRVSDIYDLVIVIFGEDEPEKLFQMHFKE